MVKKITKYLKFVVCCALIMCLVAPSYAALSASDGSAFVTKAEFDSALADFNARLTTFEAGINSKIDSQVSSYLDRNGIWNGKIIDKIEFKDYEPKILKILSDFSSEANYYVSNNFATTTGTYKTVSHAHKFASTDKILYDNSWVITDNAPKSGMLMFTFYTRLWPYGRHVTSNLMQVGQGWLEDCCSNLDTTNGVYTIDPDFKFKNKTINELQIKDAQFATITYGSSAGAGGSYQPFASFNLLTTFEDVHGRVFYSWIPTSFFAQCVDRTSFSTAWDGADRGAVLPVPYAGFETVVIFFVSKGDTIKLRNQFIVSGRELGSLILTVNASAATSGGAEIWKNVIGLYQGVQVGPMTIY